MDFELDEQQRMLQTTAHEFLAAECDKTVVRKLEASASGHSPELWKRMAELGWTGIVVPEQYGGVGLGLLELAILFEEIGKAAFESPLFGVVTAALALLEGGSDTQKASVLPHVAAGNLIPTWAAAERDVSTDFRFVSVPARREDDGFVIDGAKLFVSYATVADEILVLARTAGQAGYDGGLSLFLVPARTPGVRFNPLRTIAPGKQFRVDFDSVRVPADRLVGPVNQGVAVLKPVVDRVTAVQCVEMAGNAQQELELTAKYTAERVQFDRPLGTFQAVQHHLANMYTDVQGARWTSYQAVSRLSQRLPAARELAIARAFTCDACQRVAFLAQQLHGGMGVDVSNDLHFYYRRAKAMELQFGAAPLHLMALEREIGL